MDYGLIKRTSLKEFEVSRYSKPIQCMKLKDNDSVVSAFVNTYDDIFISTNSNYGLWFSKEDIPVVGIKASGVKSMKLKNDHVVSAFNFNGDVDEHLIVITNKGTAKRVKMEEFEKSSRANRGLLLLREVKTNPYQTVKTLIAPSRSHIGIKTPDINLLKVSEISIMDRYSTGSTISKHDIIDAFKVVELVSKDRLIDDNNDDNTPKDEEQEEIKPIKIEDSNDITEQILYEAKPEEEKVEVKKEEKPKKKETNKVSLKEIDDRLMTIDDFLGDF